MNEFTGYEFTGFTVWYICLQTYQICIVLQEINKFAFNRPCRLIFSRRVTDHAPYIMRRVIFFVKDITINDLST